MKSICNRNGSLLIEALLAIVIMSVSLTVIIQSMTSSLRATVYSLDYSKAAFLAENKMFDILCVSDEGGAGTREGSFKEPFEKYRYRISSKELPDTQNDSLREVNLDVSWGIGKKTRELSLKTYAFVPEQ
ncbi:MAG: hypothetical protein KAJ18_03430 [Candidatus Omnitrophica bacterium]|nr:hypothetical protein [Candidatus Omnitrophota bacterium]